MDEKLYLQMIYFITCALHKKTPNLEVAGPVDLKRLYIIAKRQSLIVMVAMGLEMAGLLDLPKIPKRKQIESEDDGLSVLSEEEIAIRKIWSKTKDKAVRRAMLFDAEREAVMEQLEKEGIWHMPLKGSILQSMYPFYGMRQMSDVDILYDKDRQMDMARIFQDRGYRIEKLGRSNHDVFMKEPIYNFEMHTALFSESLSLLREKYQAVKDSLLLEQGKKYRYHFGPEDFYVYIMAHGHKHFSHSGTGLRTLIDHYILWENVKKQEDWRQNYVEEELSSLGLYDYDCDCKELGGLLFGQNANEDIRLLTREDFTEKQWDIFLFCCGCGTYGNMETRVSNALKDLQDGDRHINRETKRRYLWHRVFPEMDWFRKHYPKLYKHKWIIPFFMIYRIIRVLILRPKYILREWKSVRKAK